MKDKAEEYGVAGKDRISELPDEILHCIIRRLSPCKQAGQMISLSRRWRSIWSSYPVVEFVPAGPAGSPIENFGHATIDRFSRDSRLVIEALKLKLFSGGPSPMVDPLLDLAFQRKANEVEVLKWGPARGSVSLSALRKYCTDASNPPTCLRTLCLRGVQFDDHRFLSQFIAYCPLLETLQLKNVVQLKSLQVRSSTLLTLHLQVIPALSELELEAPRLNRLTISQCSLTISDIDTVISQLPSLKRLTLTRNAQFANKLRLTSPPQLQEFKLSTCQELEAIEFNGGPGLSNFKLEFSPLTLANKLSECQISNVPDTCRYEVYFDPPICPSFAQEWFVGLKSFVTRFPQFQAVNINSLPCDTVDFKAGEMDHAMGLASVKHLNIRIGAPLSYFVYQGEFLDGLFWACRPNLFSIVHDGVCRVTTFHISLLDLVPRYWLDSSVSKEFNQRHSWESELESVEITTPDIDKTVDEDIDVGWKLEEEEKELHQENVELIALLGIHDRICFKLTWRQLSKYY